MGKAVTFTYLEAPFLYEYARNLVGRARPSAQ